MAGERTLRAAKLAGLTHVDVKILEGEVGSAEVKKLQLVENLMREGLSDVEVYLACTELMSLEPQRLKQLSDWVDHEINPPDPVHHPPRFLARSAPRRARRPGGARARGRPRQPP